MLQLSEQLTGAALKPVLLLRECSEACRCCSATLQTLQTLHGRWVVVLRALQAFQKEPLMFGSARRRSSFTAVELTGSTFSQLSMSIISRNFRGTKCSQLRCRIRPAVVSAPLAKVPPVTPSRSDAIPLQAAEAQWEMVLSVHSGQAGMPRTCLE